MARRVVPDNMAAYATYELSQLLARLTPPQRDAVGRIVKHHYLDNKPMAHLFDGDDAICAEKTYYYRGFWDEDRGEWRKVGWSHQPDFKAALELATRLALAAEQGEELHAVRQAVRRARLASAPLVGTVVRIATDGHEKTADRLAASRMILDIALARTDTDANEPQTETTADWWSAANDD